MFRNSREGTPITNPSPRINFDLIKKSKLLRRKSKSQNSLGKELPAERSNSEGSKSILRKFKRTMSGSVLNTKSKLPPQPPYAQQQSHFPLVQKQQNHKVQQSSSKSQYVSMTQTDAISATVSRDDDFSKLGKMMSNDENDHQTATTAATNSYSLDDGSTIFSESGTEIIMPFKGSGVMVDGKHRSSTPYAAHSFKAGSHTFTVDTKYSLIRVVGSGAYGVVISAHDTSTNKKVAIKMVPRAFHDEVDAKRILREIKLLKHLKHENIISLLDMMPPLAHHVEDFNDVYIVADLMETDLHRIIYSKQPLTLDHVQYFVYQILRALKYIHSANILHRDLKPSNLLVNSNCDLKVCDLGLARGVMPEDDKNAAKLGGSMLLTEYVVTRWYRAPEIMLACHEYSKPIDVWSIGCIFAELLQRKPYFPGEDYIDQLNLITDKLGKLPDEDLDFVTSEKAKRFMRKLPDKEVPSLRRQFPGTPPEALDLLGKMLQIHPTKRITVCEALEHPFLAQLHCPEDEPVAETTFDFSFEDEKLHRVRLQELIWEEIGDFRPSCLPIPPRKDGSSAPQTKQRSTLGRLYSA